MANKPKSIHGEWSSQYAFILAASGAAVGLGNIWKFPYIAGQNGGGAFVIVYLICIAILGIPILTAEVMIGRRGRQNPAGAMQYVAQESSRSKHWQWVGLLTILCGFLILSYYTVIAGWALDYVYQSMAGHFNNASPQQIDFLFNDLISSPGRLLFWDSLIVISTITVVAGGVKKGLERAVLYLFPAMIVLLLALVFYSVGTGYFGQGLEFLFKPNFSLLTPKSMLIALGHAFFTLSLAAGSIMVYGAYLPKNASVTKAALAVAAADTFIALIAGLAIFPIVFANGLEPGAGPGLIFKTLPIAFGQMPYGSFFATLFFVMLVFAAFTSAISLLEPTVAWLMEKFSMRRVAATMSSGFVLWLIGFGTIFSFNIGADYKLFGMNFFECLDYLTANIMMPLGGLLIAIFTGWYMKRENKLNELNISDRILFKTWRFTLKFISPIAVIFVFLNVVGIIHFNHVS